MTIYTEIAIDDNDENGDWIERIVEVTFDYSPGLPATRYEPEEGPDIDIRSWRMADGLPAPDWLEDWMGGDACIQELIEHAEGYAIGRAEAQAEARAGW
jgi:hypothetical protein